MGTPAEIADKIMRSGTLAPDETQWWDVEDWPEENVVRWTPAEVEARALALRDAGHPLNQQGIYLSQNLANNGGYREVVERLGLKLWVASYTSAPHILLRAGWKTRPVLWQYTSSNLPAFRAIYDANLDVNRDGKDVWLVEDLQRALNEVSNAGLTVDNDYGNETTKAVIVFQRANGLVADGDAGPLTLTKLAELLGN